jgi:hypothetical protein
MASRDDIQKRLERLRRQLPRIVADVQTQVARQVKMRAQLEASTLFAAQQYIAATGDKKRLGAIKAKYRQAKVRAGLDPRRGHKHGRLAKAIDQMVKLTPDRKSIKLTLASSAYATPIKASATSLKRLSTSGLQVACIACCGSFLRHRRCGRGR